MLNRIRCLGVQACANLVTLSLGLAAQGDSVIAWAPLYEPGVGGAMVALQVSPHDSRRVLVTGDMLGAGLSTDGGMSWQPTYGFASYELCDVTWHPSDPNIVWMGTCMGPYVSRDGGTSWAEMRAGMPDRQSGRYTAIVEKVLFDPTDPQRLLAFGGSSRRWNQADSFGWVWESKDAGATWSHVTTLTGEGSTQEKTKGVNIVAAAFLPGHGSTKLAALGSGRGVYLSDDGGRTWRRSNDGLPTLSVNRLAVHPTDPGVMWVSLDAYRVEGEKQPRPGGVFKTVDGGRTWQDSSSGLSQHRGAHEMLTASYRALAVATTDPQRLYTNDASWHTGVIYRSDDGGATWRPIVTKQNIGVDETDPQRQKLLGLNNGDFILHAGLSLTGLEIDPSDAQTVYGFGTESIAKTSDGGATWLDASAVRADTARPELVRGRGYTGWCATNIAFNPYRAEQVILQAMDAGRAWISDDGMQTWRYASDHPHPWLGGQDTSFARDGTIFVSTGCFNQFNGILRSRDWGATWEVLAGSGHGLPDAGWGHAPEAQGIYVHPDDSTRVWVVMGGRLRHSDDNGQTWADASGDLGLTWIAGDPTKPGRFYCSGRQGVYVFDGGELKNIGGPRPADRGRINCDARGRVLACAWRKGRAGVWRYDPADQRWTRLLDEHLAFECVADPRDPTRLALMTSDDPYHDRASGRGVWLSSDDGASWSAANEALPMLRGQAIAFSPDGERLVVGTFGRGFFTATWPRDLVIAGERRYTGDAEDLRFAAVPPVKDPPFEIVNGSMTEDAGGVPTGWTQVWGEGKVARDTAVAKSEPASLQLTVAAADRSGQVFQQFEGGAGQTLRLRGAVRSRGQARVNVALQAFDASWGRNEFKQIKFVQDDTEWIEFEGEATLPAWTTRFNVLLLVEGSGSAWLDDIEFVRRGQASEAAR